MDPRLAAMQGAMAEMPMEQDPVESEMPMAQPPAGPQDETGAINQALELLAPFASNPAILQALQILQESSGGGPEGVVPEDTMPEDLEQGSPLA